LPAGAKFWHENLAGGQGAGNDGPGFAGNVAFFSAMLVMTGLLIACAEMGLWLPRLNCGN
jgi:hypothetical protein